MSKLYKTSGRFSVVWLLVLIVNLKDVTRNPPRVRVSLTMTGKSFELIKLQYENKKYKKKKKKQVFNIKKELFHTIDKF